MTMVYKHEKEGKIDEKDYLFWKYDKLKDICNNEPVYYQSKISTFLGEKEYKCQPFYRMNSKIIDDLKPIRDMSTVEKIKTLDDFSLCLYLLDDASRSESSWDLCVAMLTSDEKDLFCFGRKQIRCALQGCRAVFQKML